MRLCFCRIYFKSLFVTAYIFPVTRLSFAVNRESYLYPSYSGGSSNKMKLSKGRCWQDGSCLCVISWKVTVKFLFLWVVTISGKLQTIEVKNPRFGLPWVGPTSLVIGEQQEAISLSFNGTCPNWNSFAALNCERWKTFVELIFSIHYLTTGYCIIMHEKRSENK